MGLSLADNAVAHRTLRQRLGRAWRAFRGDKHVDLLPRNNDGFDPHAAPSDVTRLFHRLRRIPGWFTVDDCAHFHVILQMQNRTGVGGDLLEIGSYYGRSTGAMFGHLKPGEKLIVCDAFDTIRTEDSYSSFPTVKEFLRNIVDAHPGADLSRIEVHECLSSALTLPGSCTLRFAHVDGGHSRDEALQDLELAYARLCPGGVIAVDDFEHPGWPEVSRGVSDFLSRHADMQVLADLNRFGEAGRKVYLIRTGEQDALV
jgi:predicted O-methyltransferase YrrM